jgi:hypothetical protein
MISEAAASRANGAGERANPVLQMVLEALNRSDKQSVLEILRSNRPKDSPLSALAESMQLRPEQEALFNVLLGLQQEPSIDAVSEEVKEPARVPQNPNMKRELADLREVNDTLAAALGACPTCWGGDEECSECEGYGHPGSSRPDPALFQQLVVPAVRRVERGNTRGRGFARGSRAKSSQS